MTDNSGISETLLQPSASRAASHHFGFDLWAPCALNEDFGASLRLLPRAFLQVVTTGSS
jgi:hypothetical protein